MDRLPYDPCICNQQEGAIRPLLLIASEEIATVQLSSGKHFKQLASASLLYTALTGLFLWPWVSEFATSVIGWVGDNYYFVWLIAWYKSSLVDALSSPLVAPQLFYPHGWPIAYNEITPLMVMLGMPIAIPFGPVAGYNFSLFLSFVLSGAGVYLWTYRLTRNTWAALVAGAAFMFVPYRLSHMYGHLNLMGTQWFPFYFLGLERALRSRGNMGAHIRTGLFFAFSAYSSMYYLYMVLLVSIFYILGFFIFVERLAFASKRFWRGIIPVFGSGLLLVLPIVLVHRHFLGLQTPGHTFEETRIWSASPSDFVLPSPQHFLWGSWSETLIQRPLWVESTLYLGVITLCLAVLSFVQRKRIRQTCQRNLLAWAFAGSVVLALGVDLHWMGESVILDVPQVLQRLHPFPRTFIPLPNYFLLEILPDYDRMRIWMRYGIFASLFLSVLAGLGANAILAGRSLRVHAAAAVIFLGLILLDFYQGPPPLSPVQGRAVDIWLAEQTEPMAVVQIPAWQMIAPEQTYYTLVHGKPFVGAFFAAFKPEAYESMARTLENFPSEESISLLRRLGVGYVLVDKSVYGKEIDPARWESEFGLKQRGSFGSQSVWYLAQP